MLRIIVMRHGKPKIDLEALKSKKMASCSLGEIVEKYELTELDIDAPPATDAMAISKDCVSSVSSDLPRAVSSVELLGLLAANRAESQFRESTLPYLELNSPKLSFLTWAILYRIAWLFGFSKNGESIIDAKRRARRGVDRLVDIAQKEQTILFMGHGIINRLIIKELKRRHWKVRTKTAEQYWSYTVLECEQ
jgi:broad specificity phosphatase PhoE